MGKKTFSHFSDQFHYCIDAILSFSCISINGFCVYMKYMYSLLIRNCKNQFLQMMVFGKEVSKARYIIVNTRTVNIHYNYLLVCGDGTLHAFMHLLLIYVKLQGVEICVNTLGEFNMGNKWS